MSEYDLKASFTNLDEWAAFVGQHPELFNGAHIERLVAQVRAKGCTSKFVGHASPRDVHIGGDNYRETITVNGLTSRMRAMLDWFLLEPAAAGEACKIFMHEAITPFALAVRGRYAYALGCEYAPTTEQQELIFPIQHCDIAAAPFPDASFNIVLSNDVFEHVADLPAAIKDTARILKPGGVLLATFPFDSMNPHTDNRAVLENGEIRHNAPPEYHGNPIDPEGGSLVFQIPGWDVLDMCRAGGFKTATIECWCSQPRGFIGAGLAAILTMRAVK